MSAPPLRHEYSGTTRGRQESPQKRLLILILKECQYDCRVRGGGSYRHPLPSEICSMTVEVLSEWIS
jgi:hypothetical protein